MTATIGKPHQGKVAMVTGASRRIGRATAIGLAEDGAAVVVTAASSKPEIDAVVAEITSAGGRALGLLVDVTDEASVAAAFARVASEFGRLDILVNNAAIRKQSSLLQTSLAEWRRVTAVILDGAFLCCRAAVPLMLQSGGGTIVNIGGVTAHIGAANRASVSAGKAGLVGLTKALAIELKHRNITVNCVVPGKIGGERSASSGESPIPMDDIPLGREGEIEEAAFIIRMMCHPLARFMTGQSVHVSGGLYLP
jgi:3-oxoacyl-[acyl-carrier protein] reductase